VTIQPLELQHVIRQLLADIDGVVDIADDVLIYAKDNAEHNQIFLKSKTLSLGKIPRKGTLVTLNLQNCKFLQSSLEF